MKYSREKFKQWLSEKPPEEMFCGKKCPIQVFMDNDLTFIGAVRLDHPFVKAIDDVMFTQNNIGHGWKTVTPAQCLQIINDL